jgi:hypothetical protein
MLKRISKKYSILQHNNLLNNHNIDDIADINEYSDSYYKHQYDDFDFDE